MKKQSVYNDYETPTLTSIECCVEAGFAVSNIGEDEGFGIPDFSQENEL